MGEHINTFSKGMTSDVSILMQPDGTYRYMKNCNIISQDGNNFSVKDCMGNTLFIELNVRYIQLTLGTPNTVSYDDLPISLAFISFPNKLIVFHTNNETEGGGYGEIGIINYTTYGEGIQPTISPAGYVPIYHHTDLKFTKLRQIEGFAYEENDLVQRVYWTDNLNEPRVINIADPIFDTYIASGSLVVGKQYMVLQGVIEHPVASTVYYGPSTGTGNISGNIFTASATTYTDMVASGIPAMVIEYYPIQLLAFTPSRSMGNIKFKEYGSGSVYCGSKIYFYRLTSPLSGINTSWSYGSSPIHVGTDNTPVAVPANTYFDFVGEGSSNTLVNSGRSVFITVDNIDQSFTNIEIAVAEFDQILETPRIINIVVSTPITGVSMDLEHTGSSNLGELTLSDVTLFPASILTCKTMTTNKNYILVANTKERTEFTDFSNVGVTITQIQHRMPVHQSENAAHAAGGQFCANILSYNSVSPSTVANPALVGGIAPYTQWVVTTGIATYNAVAYGPAQVAGQVFEGVAGVYNWADTSGTAVVRPCVSRNRYTTGAGVKRPDWIQFNQNASINSGDWSYKNPAVASHVKGLWSNQTYRYGILFYDLKGNPFYVRWLKDFTTDTVQNIPLMEDIQINAGGDKDWYLSQNGVSISGITIPPSIINAISGFSIVRAERDATIMSQGLFMQTCESGASGLIFPLPSPNVKTCDSEYTTAVNQVYTYICPDKLVEYPVNNYAVGSTIKTSHWLKPRDFFSTGYNMTSSSDGYEATETKYFEQLAAETNVDPNRNYKITAMANVDEFAAVTNFGSANFTFGNNVKFRTAFAVNPTDGICFGGATPNLQSCQAAGGKRTLIEVDNYPWAYNLYGVSGYMALNYADVKMDYKMMANITVDKTTLYGGQSAAALANTFYISTGHFQPITSAVKADTFDGTNYVFNNVEVWGGDCFNCLIDYGHSLYDVALPAGVVYVGYSWGIKFACQCNSNYDLRRGRTIANNRMAPAATGVSYNPVRLEGFSYNKGYSTQGLEFAYPALPVKTSTLGQFKFRIRYGGQKFPGETVDTYRVFKTNDYKDTDGQGGEINNLKTKDGRTVVWQNKIINTVPILERQLMPGTTGGILNIGTGGVVDRFDPIDSYFGNQHQWGLTETEYGFAWFDMRRKAFVTLDFSSGIQEVSQINGMKGFFDEVILEVLGSALPTTNILNSQIYDKTSDRPLVGVGITGAYDPKFKTTYMTFKYKARAFNSGNHVIYINRDFTIMYYHPNKCFIGFSDWTPGIAHNHNQTVFSSNNPKNKTKYYGAGMDSTTFAIGEVVSYKNREYICVLGLTIASYPGAANQVPDYAGSTYWLEINKTNQIWAHNQPKNYIDAHTPDYEYSKFFGQVVDNELWFVINPKTQNPFNVLSIEQHGNNQNVTSIYTYSQYQDASDVNISPTSRFYRWIYNCIASNLPIGKTGRISDSYLFVKFIKKNWTTEPFTRTVGVKVLQFVKSYFQEKR